MWRLGEKIKGNILFELKKASSDVIRHRGLFLLYFILHHIVICQQICFKGTICETPAYN